MYMQYNGVIDVTVPWQPHCSVDVIRKQEFWVTLRLLRWLSRRAVAGHGRHWVNLTRN
jgi:hypothetical protein